LKEGVFRSTGNEPMHHRYAVWFFLEILRRTIFSVSR